jgi:undecaprenyl diphosphate synthase
MSQPLLASNRVPRHVGLIPDGNRRWARARGLNPGAGYAAGVECGVRMLDECLDLGIEEVSVYGFTQDNTKRPAEQRADFSAACVGFVEQAMQRDVALRVVGDCSSPMFPKELVHYSMARRGAGTLKVNLLVNYGWQWDLQTAICAALDRGASRRDLLTLLASSDVSRIDLIVRWGGMRRLSGFLPVQSVYADFYVVDAFWPDYQREQFVEALEWFARQDVTLGG